MCFNSTNEQIRELFCENNELWAENTELKEKIFKVIVFIDTWKKYKKENKPLEVSLLDLLYIKEILGGKKDEN